MVYKSPVPTKPGLQQLWTGASLHTSEFPTERGLHPHGGSSPYSPFPKHRKLVNLLHALPNSVLGLCSPASCWGSEGSVRCWEWHGPYPKVIRTESE